MFPIFLAGTCLRCNRTTFKKDPFYDLPIPFEKSIEDSFEKFTASALFDEKNLPYCDFCKQATGHRKKADIVELPQVLSLQVLRHYELLLLFLAGNYYDFRMMVSTDEVMVKWLRNEFWVKGFHICQDLLFHSKLFML